MGLSRLQQNQKVNNENKADKEVVTSEDALCLTYSLKGSQTFPF